MCPSKLLRKVALLVGGDEFQALSDIKLLPLPLLRSMKVNSYTFQLRK
jgi:hypothetical protein